MKYELNTERLVLRNINLDQDVQILVDIMNDNPAMSDFMTWEPPMTVEAFRGKLEKGIKKGDIPFSVFLKSDKGEKLVGELVLRNLVWSQQESSKNSAFLSFWVNPKVGVRGLGTEMLREACFFAFKDLGLRKLFAGVFVDNIGSQKVLEKINFRKIGLSHNHYLKKGKWINSLRYELLAHKFLNKNELSEIKRIDKKSEKYKNMSSHDLKFKIDNFEIRSLVKEDVDEIFEVLIKNPEISDFKIWNQPKTKEEVLERIIMVKDSQNLNLGVFENNKFVGRISLTNFRYKQEASLKNSAFMNFFFLPGVNLENQKNILQYLIDYGFRILTLRKIFAPIFSRNRSAQKVLRDLDFLIIGFLEDHYRKNNKHFDSMRYEILNPDLMREVEK